MSLLDAPPPVGPRGLAIRVAEQGAAAQRAGAPVLACPYDATRPFSRRAWLIGYLRAARAAGAPTPDQLVDEVEDDAPWPGDTP